MPLSRRETEILVLIAAGRTTKAVAAALGVRVSTVEWHVSNILVKLEASSRTEAVAIAVRAGLLSPQPEVASHARRGPRGSKKSALDALDRVLDKGIVIETHLNVAVGGIRLIGIEGHVMVISTDTYLKDRGRLPGSLPVADGAEHSEGSSVAVTRAVEEYLRRLRPDAGAGSDQ